MDQSEFEVNTILLLIGWESGSSFANQVQRGENAKPKQTKSALDGQLETALD